MRKLLLSIVLLPVLALAQDEFSVDENALFGDTNSIVAVSSLENGSTISNSEKESVSFSGTIQNRSSWQLKRDWLKNGGDMSVNPFMTYLLGEVYLDVRLRKGIKAFVNLSAVYSPQSAAVTKKMTEITTTGPVQKTFIEQVNTIILFKEFFLDANILQKVYLRAGKQVLQWGRGYFWNPTDLVNIERKNFFDMTRSREGNYGLKVHVPFGTVVNLYGFVDFNNIKSPADCGTAGKVEFVLGGTEAAFSAWQKDGFLPVYGFDFSSRLFTVDLWGEAAVSEGNNQKKVRIRSVTIPVPMIYAESYQTKGWVCQASLGLSRSFDIVTEDRLMLVAEFYWNSDGYESNMFADKTKGELFASPLTGYYRSGSYRKCYSSFFLTFNRFFHQDLTASASALVNWDDLSETVSAGVSWTPVYNFTTGLSVYGFLGNKDTEYGRQTVALYPELSLQVVF